SLHPGPLKSKPIERTPWREGTMQNLQATAKKFYHYRWATSDEKRTLNKSLLHDRSVNQWKYKERYVEGANPQRPAYLRFSSPTFLEERTPRAPAVFHEGLMKDQEGIYWIVKKFNPRAR